MTRLSRSRKRLILIASDAVLTVFSLWAALAVRLGTPWPEQSIGHDWWIAAVLPLASVIIFWHLGLYRLVLRSMGRYGAIRIAEACLVVSLLLAAVAYLDKTVMIPRSTPIIFGLALFTAMLASRAALRAFYGWFLDREVDKLPVLIYGAGASGSQLMGALTATREFKPIGFLDDDKLLWGSLVMGRRVFGPADIDRLARRYGIRDVLLAIPSASRDRRREILRFLSDRRLRVRTIPSMVELVTGVAEIDRLSEIRIDDLLGRDAVAPIPDLFASVRGQSVLVTGAGGSIGSELCRQIVDIGARRIILLEMSEYALYSIERELRPLARRAGIDLVALLGSACDEQGLRDIITRHGVQTIYHAAAYKHVPLVEVNAVEGVRNNVFGALAAARAAAACRVQRVILISTDKAVRPTNIMGASKRFAEKIFQDLQRTAPDTIFTMVRFGNVVGSSGSVVPLFRQQIEAGGPVTVTHPEVIRYFMTIPEAAHLVIQAGSIATGGDVFVLDMGSRVSILDLARRMIHLAGLSVRDETNPDGDIAIEFTGLRPGEKLFEELLIDSAALPTLHPKIMRAPEEGVVAADIAEALADLARAIELRDCDLVKDVLSRVVEGYRPAMSGEAATLVVAPRARPHANGGNPAANRQRDLALRLPPRV